jgi:TP901 family phage tail tape measure protein
MASEQTARLNLQITARDEANQVIKKFAEQMKATFEGIQKVMKETFGDQIVVKAKEMTEGINQSIKGINASVAAREIGLISEATFLTRTEAEEQFNLMRDKMKSATLQGVESAKLSMGQLRAVLREVGEDKSIQLFRDRYMEAMAQIEQTTFMTRAQLETSFNAIKNQNLELGLSFKEASQFTTEQLKRIVEAAKATRVEVIKEASQTKEAANKYKEAFDKIAKSAFMTKEDVAKAFEQVKGSFNNASLAAQSSATMTSEAMARIVSAAREMEIRVVQSNERVSRSARSMFHSFSSGAMDLQFAGEMIKGFSEKITGFLGESAKSFIEFNQEIVNTQMSLQVLGEKNAGTKKTYKELEKAALDMGKQGFFSANEVGQAMNTLAKQGVDSQAILHGAMKASYDAAAANQMGLEETANVVSDIYHEMGESLKASFEKTAEGQKIMNSNMSESQKQAKIMEGIFTQVGDAMTGALHQSRISMTDFLNSMKYAGPQASALGVNMGELSTMIALLGQHGIRGSQAGTTLRRMLTNLTPASKDAAAMMEKLGMITKDGGNIFYDAQGKLKPMAEVQQLLHDKLAGLTPQMQQLAVKTIFGQYALSGMTAIVGTSTEKYKELQSKVTEAGLAQDAMKVKSQGLGMQVQKLNAHFETIKKEIGEQLRPVIEKVIGVATGLMDRWDHLSDKNKKMIVTIAAVVGAVTAVVGGIMAFIGTLGIFISILGSGLAAMGTFAGVLFSTAGLFNPITLAIGAVIAVCVLLYKAFQSNFGGIRTLVMQVWGYIGPQIMQGITVVKNAIIEGVKTITTWWKTMSPTFEQAVKNIVKFLTWLSPLWKAVWFVIKEIVKGVWDGIKNIVQGAWKVLSGIFQLIADVLTGKWKKAWGDVKQILVGVLQFIWGLLETGFLGKIIKVIGEVFAVFKTFGGSAKTIFTEIFSFIKKVVSDGMGYVKSIFSSGFSVLKTTFNTLKSTLSDIISAIVKLFKGDFSGAWTSVKSAFSTGVSGVKNIVNGLFGFFDKGFGGLPGKFRDWASNMMNMFKDGIENKIGEVTAKIKKLGDKIKDLLGFHSPTKEGPLSKGESDVWFPNMMKMFAQGIEDNKDKVFKSVTGVALGIKHTIEGTQPSASNSKVVQSYSAPTAQTNGQRPVHVTIQIDGRSKETDKQLAEHIANAFRTQMNMVSG